MALREGLWPGSVAEFSIANEDMDVPARAERVHV